MSAARHHAEWLSLVETSGPFLSMPVLMRVFPQGLEQRNPAKAAELREAYEDWQERGGKQFAVHQAWVRHVLEKLLDYPPEFLAEGQAIPPGMEATMSNFAETLRPDFVLKHRDAGQKPLLLIEHYPREQDLEKPVAGKLWKASPGTRMMELLHATDVPLGLVTNGEQWMLVYAPRGETTGFASWYADLWMQEPITLRAFHSLLHLRRFLGVAEPDTLAGLYAASSKDQQEVTDQLGYQVRQAVEMLVQAFDRIDAESGRTLLADVTEKALYDSALTVMMRLVFLFSADERGLLLLGDPLYDQHYAVSTLSELLRERADQHGEEILGHRHDAWCRLLATFRAVHAGVEHEAMRLPPYGGTLFDPDRYPFLEGRPAKTRWRDTPATPLPINNRVVLHLLEALQMLRVKVPGGGPTEARRLSFRALDIEQIGHVYEGLLDHTAKRARETILGLAGSKNTDAEIPLSKLEQVAQKDTAALVEFLHEETGRSEKTLQRLIEEPPSLDAHALLIACGQDSLLAQRVRPFAGLLRADSFEKLVVIPEGSVYVTAGSDRRSTGTHYTPRSLTEPIVQHTLEPLVYAGPAEGQPQDQWQLKSPREILALKVCDMAMGSGAFLVQTCRYLGERLVEAWENAEKANPGQFIATPEGELSSGDPSERLIPADPAERLAIARRYVADRCLYGVDINPMAVEMAKLSLWLITLQRDRPFTFLDHALKCGDSLLGVSDLEQLERFSLKKDPSEEKLILQFMRDRVREATAKRTELESLPSESQHMAHKAALNDEAEKQIRRLKLAADLLIASEMKGLFGQEAENARNDIRIKVAVLLQRGDDTALEQLSREQLGGRRTFHWPVEFPEVFTSGGFDAFVGNPPFMGGQKITGSFGTEYRDFIVQQIAHGRRGSADLCAYFFLRVHSILKPDSGICGLIATNTIAQGDTREVGLDQLSHAKIIRAVPSAPWPGAAALEVAHVWLRRGSWAGDLLLNNRSVRGITPFLTELGLASGKPMQLAANANKSFQGSIILGMGFVLTPEQAQSLIEQDENSRDVLFPYLGGEDLNSRPDQSASRWVINFRDWPLDRSVEGCWHSASDAEREAWLKIGKVPDDYPKPVAADFRHCLEVVERLVKPERAKLASGDTTARDRARRWWRYGRSAFALYGAISGYQRVLVKTQVSKQHALDWVASGHVFDQRLICFAAGETALPFALLQSSIHEEWSYANGATLETRPTYTPGTCFETFPFPANLRGLETVGEYYHEHRRQLMLARLAGLTKTYNRFHDRGEKSEDIARLRALHEEMDQAVAAAYGWSDLDLGHGFHATKQGERYTLSEPARRTVLDRLLALNHHRYAEELKAGLHEKGAKKKGKKANASPGAAPQAELIPPPQKELFN